jgi:hypothetical protein
MTPKAIIAAIIAALAIAGTARTAHAQPSRPFQLELTGGFRAGSGNGVVGEGRLFAGYAHHLARTDRRSLFFAVGPEATAGSISFDDPRGIDGEISAQRRTYGPSVRAGWAWSKHSWPQIYTFAGATAVIADTRTDSLMLVDAGRAYGSRFALGVALPGSYAAIVEKGDDADCNSNCGFAVLFALAPNTLEITMEQLHAGGESVRRWGLGLGWSL